MSDTKDNSSELQLLLDLAAAGDQQAHGELIARASERLLRLTRKMLADFRKVKRWEDTDDVFQTAVVKLYRSLFEIRPASVREFFGLAATQIRRTLLDLARHYYGPEGHGRKHHSDGIPSPDADETLEQLAGSGECPEALEPWVRFHQSIEQLPQMEREVFHLIWYAGLAQSEVAAMLGLSLSTVQRRWNQARQLLGALMQGDPPTAGGE